MSKAPSANNTTSWQNLSKWYDNVIGDKGSDLHQKLIFPTVLQLLNLQKDMKVLDIGCGNGVFAKKIIEHNAKYFGIDSSISLIDSAKRRNSFNAKFKVAGICDNNLKNILNEEFDRAIFIMSIQDIDPLDKAFENLSQILKKESEVIIFMLHPAFKIPRQSGFVYDDNRKMISRRIDSYLTENAIPYKRDLQNKRYIADFYHRPIEVYVNSLSKYGFLVKNLLELPNFTFDRLPDNTKLKYDFNSKPDISRIEKRVLKEIPVYMVIKAVKC